MFSKKLIITIFAITALSYGSHAQTGIGTRTPDASTILELNATDKGFLLPRVTLTSNTDATTIASPATGLMVYNLGGALGAGVFWNTGTPASPVWATPVLLSPTVGSVVDKLIYRTSTGADGTQILTSGRFEFRFVPHNQNPVRVEFRLATSPVGSVDVTYHVGQYYGGFEYNNFVTTYTGADFNTWKPLFSGDQGLSTVERNELYLTYPGDDTIWQVNFVVLNSGTEVVYAILSERY